MKISLCLDEDARDNGLFRALRSRGVDVITVREADRLGYSDLEQLEWAAIEGRVIYTFNRRDFFQLHTAFLTQGRNHAGIILAPQQHYSVGEQMRRLLNLIETKSAEEMQNQIEFLSAWG